MPTNDNDLVPSNSLDSATDNTTQIEREELAGNSGKKFVKGRRRRTQDAPALGESSHKQKGRLSKPRLIGFELRHINLSQPVTRQPVPSGSKDIVPLEAACIDPKLLKHLTTLLEEEINHTSNVVQDMQANKAKESQILSVYNVMRQLTRLRLQLFRFQEHPTAATLEIGASPDIEIYLKNIETVCETAKEIVLQHSGDGELECSGKNLDTNTEPVERVRLRRAPKTTSLDKLVKQFEHGLSKINPQMNQSNKNNTKEGLENYRRLETRRKRNYKLEEKSDKKKLFYKTGTIDRLSDTDTDEEMSNMNTLQAENQKFQWPKLNTKDQNLIHKEATLFTLMSEIDELMKEVGLTDKKHDPTNLSYEVVMMGSGEMNNKKLIPRKKSVAPKFAAKTFKPTNEIITVRKSKEKTDAFVDELDKLLDECDLK